MNAFALEAAEPPEQAERSRRRALLVASAAQGAAPRSLRPARRFLGRGRSARRQHLRDVALPAARAPRGRGLVRLHFSTRRTRAPGSSSCAPPDRMPFPAPRSARGSSSPAARATPLLAPVPRSDRLSIARLRLGAPLEDYLARHGRPIRYRHAPRERPIDAYQTVFAREPGSAEMPSAGARSPRSSSPSWIARGVLVRAGDPHAGVSSLERGEAPYPERYRVPAGRPRAPRERRAGGQRPRDRRRHHRRPRARDKGLRGWTVSAGAG